MRSARALMPGVLRSPGCAPGASRKTLLNSPQRDDRAETGSVRAPPVRRQKGGFLRAEVERVDFRHAGLFKLGSIGGRKIQQEAVALAFGDEPRVEARGDLFPHLVAATADPRTDARVDPCRLDSVLVDEGLHGRGSNACDGAAPTRVDQGSAAALWLPQHDGIAVG